MKNLTKKQTENDLNERPKEFTDYYNVSRKEWYRVTEKPEIKSTLPYKLYWLCFLGIIALAYFVKQITN